MECKQRDRDFGSQPTTAAAVYTGTRTTSCVVLRGGYATVMVTSAQFCHTCAVSSQSQRHPSTYSPGERSWGRRTVSAITPSVQSPEHSPCPLPSVLHGRLHTKHNATTHTSHACGASAHRCRRNTAQAPAGDLATLQQCAVTHCMTPWQVGTTSYPALTHTCLHVYMHACACCCHK